ncbi:DNA cross-link repair protein PSO2/SNM1 [Mycena indigotica]|uniref:DNA cross-link repair protein PSO2/SNM1 n=1 Tax=Mycena indigotica TaxID=2126181 RepID=A0A8H6T0Z2_9AGAR|nr:DNA cross-link repair protein PSO2/SNM1 [Mycena indigotica]KAF7309980.1 DNA cross-link repair protein PSO2/SNM1 [Mycena indigotica]
MPPRRKSLKTATPKAQGTLRDFFGKQKQPTSAPKEVIVIDSDTDTDSDIEVFPKKRKLLSGSSVEIVGNSSKPTKRVSLPSVPALSFGQPTLLLSDAPCPSLLHPADDEATEESTKFNEAAVYEEDWGTGDDEIGVADNEEEDPSAIDDIASLVCPLCQLSLSSLSELDRQSHVNSCLDAASAQPQAGPSELKPLSAIPIPNACAPSKNDAFSVLMNIRKENAVWTEAEAAEASRATKKNRRKAPFYKVMEGMPIAVDAFRYGSIPGVTSYFLTHAHSDHYTNLSSSWKHGPIYCSNETANLITHILSVDKQWVHPLPMDVPMLVPDSGGVHVTLISANHCPGSCLFLFEGPQTVHAGDSSFPSPWIGSSRTFRYLHCGDFRASPQHTEHPAVNGKRLDHVYLDTTYLDPRYTFPPQPLVILACADLAKRLSEGKSPDSAGSTRMDQYMTSPVKSKQKERERILMVVGTYSVGKERIVKAVAEAIDSKIYCDARKMGILRCQSDPDLHAMLTDDPLAADVHILPLGKIAADKLQAYLDRFKGTFTKVIGFRPTGWTYSPPAGAIQSPTISSVIVQTQQKTFTHANLRPSRTTSAAVLLYPIPYSEHSSFFELTCFALALDWRRMIATVNVGSQKSRVKMDAWMKKWEAERKNLKVRPRRSDFW